MMYGPHLRSRREQCGLSRPELAQALETTVNLIAQWEEGISLPPPALQAALDQFFEGTDRGLREVVEVNTPSQDNNFVFLLLSPSEGGDAPLSTATVPVFSDPFLPPPFAGKDRL